MRNTFFILFITLFAFNISSFAQTKTDSSKIVPQNQRIDTARQMKVYAIILNEADLNLLMAYLKSADEKPSKINQFIFFLSKQTTEITQKSQQIEADKNKKGNGNR